MSTGPEVLQVGMKINCKHVEQTLDLIFNQSTLRNYIKVPRVPTCGVFVFAAIDNALDGDALVCV